jgi:hypothetical protein
MKETIWQIYLAIALLTNFLVGVVLVRHLNNKQYLLNRTTVFALPVSAFAVLLMENLSFFFSCREIAKLSEETA